MTKIAISTINESLLRSLGTGVAIIRLSDLCLFFQNETFAQWFDNLVGDRPEQQIKELVHDKAIRA